MYDFCFTPLYAGLLAVGGLIGYATKGSIGSLGAGLGSALILGICAKHSLNNYHLGKTCKPATAVSLLIASVLTYVMYNRYNVTRKVMPAGLTAAVSAVMTVFYIWSLLLGPVPKLQHAKAT